MKETKIKIKLNAQYIGLRDSMRVKITLTNTLVCYKKYSYLRITPKNFHSRLILKNSLVLKKISKDYSTIKAMKSTKKQARTQRET